MGKSPIVGKNGKNGTNATEIIELGINDISKVQSGQNFSMALSR